MKKWTSLASSVASLTWWELLSSTRFSHLFALNSVPLRTFHFEIIVDSHAFEEINIERSFVHVTKFPPMVTTCGTTHCIGSQEIGCRAIYWPY
jgi:hypothetical protein